jgi:transposase-like protein
MPWRETSAMDERLRFVQDVHRPGWSIAALCWRYEVSRKTGYKWLHAYERAGPTGLADGSHRPHTSPQARPPPVVRLILDLQRRYTWGARKVRRLLLGPRPGRSGTHQDDDSPDPRAAWAGASAAAQRPALPRGRTGHADGSTQRGLDRGFQGPIPHRQRRVQLSPDGPGRLDAVSARLMDSRLPPMRRGGSRPSRSGGCGSAFGPS